MKNHIILLAILLLLPAAAYGQDDFEEYARRQQRAFNEYAAQEDKDFKAYADSVNLLFGKYLAEVWPDCPLFKPVRPIDKPVPPEVYQPDKPRPEPVRIPEMEDAQLPLPPLSIPKRDMKPPIPDIKVPEHKPSNKALTKIFNEHVYLTRLSCSFPKLKDISEQQVANYWNGLSKMPFDKWKADIAQLKSEQFGFDGWGTFCLIKEVFRGINPSGTANESVIFTVFTLNQLGYRAKIGRCGNQLLPLLAFECDILNATYFTNQAEPGVKYYIVDRLPTAPQSVKCCSMTYPQANRSLEIERVCPALTNMDSDSLYVTKILKDKKRSYSLNYNPLVVEYRSTMPCLPFNYYVEADLDSSFSNSITEVFAPLLFGLSETEQINLLLHFVQYAFDYKTDDDQFGYEKWFFAEETIGSKFSDCEDRSILFAQLVRHLLHKDVVLIYYPGRHLATAVCFSDQALKGDYVMVDGKKYLLCDPTYIGAGYGMAMPQLKDIKINIIKIRNNSI